MSYIDEIKERATECMSTDECLFCSWFSGAWCDRKSFAMCVLEALKQIEAQLDQVTRERDAAVAEFTEAMKYCDTCIFCKHLEVIDDEGGCSKTKIMPGENCWQWRGVEVEG